jgi:hypothetical protein
MDVYKLGIIAVAIFFASCKNGNNKQDNDDKLGVLSQTEKSAAPAGTLEQPSTPDESKMQKNAVSPQSLTPNEQKGINQVKSFYGCECKFAIGRDSKSGVPKRFFQLEASNGPMLDSTRAVAELTVSNIAILFYQNLGEDGKKYDEIIASALFSDGQKAVKTYPVATLEMVLAKTNVLGTIIDRLKDKDYDKLEPLLNDKNGIVQYDKKKLINQIRQADPQLGNIKTFIPYGFMFFKSDNQKDILHISGLVVRDKQNNEFSVDFDPLSGKNEALFINYKL